MSWEMGIAAQNELLNSANQSSLDSHRLLLMIVVNMVCLISRVVFTVVLLFTPGFCLVLSQLLFLLLVPLMRSLT